MPPRRRYRVWRHCNLWKSIHKKFKRRPDSPAKPKVLATDGSAESLTALPAIAKTVSARSSHNNHASDANGTAVTTSNDALGSHDTLRELPIRPASSLFAQPHILKRRSSASLFQTVLRRKMSKDSAWSGTSKRDSLASVTEEELERKREMKRALSERLRGDFLPEQPDITTKNDTDQVTSSAEPYRPLSLDASADARAEAGAVEHIESVATPQGVHRSQSFPERLLSGWHGSPKVEGSLTWSSRTWPVSERLVLGSAVSIACFADRDLGLHRPSAKSTKVASILAPREC